MSKPKILVQLDTDLQPSVFDGVVAVDAGVDHLFRHGGVTPENVRDLVYGCIFTRGGADLASTAIFIGGSDVAHGEKLLSAVRKTMFGPMRVSVLLDSNGSNTTAAAAVLAVGEHLPLANCQVAVLAATGPVGSRVVRLLASQGAVVLVGSRDLAKAQATCQSISERIPQAKLKPFSTANGIPIDALPDIQAIVATGPAGVELLTLADRKQIPSLKLAMDLNAVPPLGLAGIEATDKAQNRDGVICYGALGVGATKMKIHKAAIAQLFTANDQVLDAEEIYALAKSL